MTRWCRFDEESRTMEFLNGDQVMDRIRMATDTDWSDKTRLHLRWTMDAKTPAMRIQEILAQLRGEDAQ